MAKLEVRAMFRESAVEVAEGTVVRFLRTARKLWELGVAEGGSRFLSHGHPLLC